MNGYDLDAAQAMGCRETLQMLWSIYMETLAGARARVRFGTRWSEYHPGHTEEIRETYMSMFAQCQNTYGLPNLAKGYQQRRGRPGIVVNSGTFEDDRHASVIGLRNVA